MSDEYVKCDVLMAQPWFRRACVQENRRRQGVLCASEAVRLGRSLRPRERMAVLKDDARATVALADAGMSRETLIAKLASEHSSLPVTLKNSTSVTAWISQGLGEANLGRLSGLERREWA